jgi:hypothetical protein
LGTDPKRQGCLVAKFRLTNPLVIGRAALGLPLCRKAVGVIA